MTSNQELMNIKAFKITYLITVILLVGSCSSDLTDAQKIIDRCIERHGGRKFSNSIIEFDFRNRHYVAERKDGMFSYERIFKEGENIVHDFLTNEGYHREINGAHVHVVDSMAAKYTRSVNSTIYFSSLPYGLNDPPVKKKFLGETIIDNRPYYKIEVTFAQEGGGEDFNDVFHFWINKENYTMDYFAYIYYTEGGGIRFRKAIKQHVVNGIVLQDYINLKPKSELTSLDSVEYLYKTNDLEVLSNIEIENVSVK